MSIDASRSADIASPIRAWHDRAEQLTDWAIARVFVRTDRFGGYYRDGEEVKKSARPNKGCGEPFSREVLIRHFRAEQTEDVIGAYPLIPGEESTGRWVAIDIDAHDKTKGADPERNRKYAEHLYRKLTALGFGVLACHWGTGGYHLWVFLDRDVPGAVLFAFARWIVLDATDAPWDYPERPETFPKQASVATGKYGNWLRLVGRHHTQRRFPAVFDGQNWVEGEPAVAIVLACTGDSPDLIPPEALPVEPKKGKGKPGGKGAKPGGFNYKVPPGGGDVFAAYNATVTLDVVVGWHEADGHKVTKREQGRVEFLRAGKAGSGQSFNVKDVDGIPITYNFSTNTGMPDGKGLTPAQVRCYRESGSCDAAAMNRFAAVLRSEMGWVKDDPQQNESTPGSTPPPPSGADPSAPPGDDPLAGEKFKDTDLANAKRFVFDNGRDCLFVADWNRWCAWDGRRWAVDRTGSIVAGLAHKTLRKMADAALEKVIAAASMMKGAACEEEEARAEKEKAAADRELAWAKKSQDARRVSAMLEMARPYLL